MLPSQKNKIDLNTLTEEENKLFRLYGKLPQKTDILNNKLKERKYFDSGDYALSKAGKASDVGIINIGSKIPSLETISHHMNLSGYSNFSGGSSISNFSGSPVKESSLLHCSILSQSSSTNDVKHDLDTSLND
ncbi:hypothetical protein MERGE_002339 [Pneumocystis wakefieldiae]|uniref:mRNA stability protein n=1 Tax=Pneumocystis wakefieldiae TaxID=38082 RepID=A0A899FXL6_9ASCO|nr:hypothetical protein MERGE_002339 [Pneumocystis wakefieldiae]